MTGKISGTSCNNTGSLAIAKVGIRWHINNRWYISHQVLQLRYFIIKNRPIFKILSLAHSGVNLQKLGGLLFCLTV